MQFRAPEVLDDVLPVRGVVISAKIWLELSAENLKSRALADTVGSHKTQDLSRSWHRKTVELEAVGGIAMGDLALEIGREVDNGDGAEGATFGADTATNA